MPRVEVPNFRPFVGQHCETVATGTLLASAGFRLSEPMLFGLGEGLGFIFIKLRSLPLPFVGGRALPEPRGPLPDRGNDLQGQGLGGARRSAARGPPCRPATRLLSPGILLAPCALCGSFCGRAWVR